MSMNVTTSDPIEVLCPHCERETEVYNFEIACMSLYVDTSAGPGDGDTQHRCRICNGQFLLRARAHLEVRGIEEASRG